MTNLEAEFLYLVRVLDLPEPVNEFRFHEIRKWKIDFFWPSKSLGVEINGGIYKGGRHSRGKGLENDYEKLNTAQLMGIKVLQFSAGMLRDGTAAKTLCMAFGKELP